MKTLFDSTRRVKSRPVRVFGQGISTSDRRQPYSAADQAWWAANSPANAKGFEVVGPSDAELDRQAGEATFLAACDAWQPRGAVALDDREEATLFIGGTPPAMDTYRGIPISAESAAEREEDWREYDRYQEAMSRWLAGRGPRPE